MTTEAESEIAGAHPILTIRSVPGSHKLTRKNTIVIAGPLGPMVTIDMSAGTVVLGEHYEFAEAVKTFWIGIAALAPGAFSFRPSSIREGEVSRYAQNLVSIFEDATEDRAHVNAATSAKAALLSYIASLEASVSSSPVGVTEELKKPGETSTKFPASTVYEALAEAGMPTEACKPIDGAAVGRAIRTLMQENSDKVSQAASTPALRGWFVGKVMGACRGLPNPAFVAEIVDLVFDRSALIASEKDR